jgi:hypothetical protein
MISLDEFEAQLKACTMIEDFVNVVAEFIASVEDAALRGLLILELEKALGVAKN